MLRVVTFMVAVFVGMYVVDASLYLAPGTGQQIVLPPVNASSGATIEVLLRATRDNVTLLCAGNTQADIDYFCIGLQDTRTTLTDGFATALLFASRNGTRMVTRSIALLHPIALTHKVRNQGKSVKPWLALAVTVRSRNPRTLVVQLFQEGSLFRTMTLTYGTTLPKKMSFNIGSSLRTNKAAFGKPQLQGYVDSVRLWNRVLNRTTIGSYNGIVYFASKVLPTLVYQKSYSPSCSASRHRGAKLSSSMLSLSKTSFPVSTCRFNNRSIVPSFPYSTRRGAIRCSTTVTSPSSSEFYLRFKLYVNNVTSSTETWAYLFRRWNSFSIALRVKDRTVQIGADAFISKPSTSAPSFTYSGIIQERMWISVAIVANQLCADRATFSLWVGGKETKLPTPPPITPNVGQPLLSPLIIGEDLRTTALANPVWPYTYLNARSLLLDEIEFGHYLGSSYERGRNYSTDATKTVTKIAPTPTPTTATPTPTPTTSSSSTPTPTPTSTTKKKRVNHTKSRSRYRRSQSVTKTILIPKKCVNGTKFTNGSLGCSSCRTGWFGAYCDAKCTCRFGNCSDGLSGNGSCTTCNKGYAGPDCKVKCDCTNGNCSEGILGTGKCVACNGNYSLSSNCALCKSTNYGPNCSLDCSCGVHGTCNNTETGDGQCFRCDIDWAGPTCSIPCKTCAADEICSQNIKGNGTCVKNPNYVPPTTIVPTPSITPSPTPTIGGSPVPGSSFSPVPTTQSPDQSVIPPVMVPTTFGPTPVVTFASTPTPSVKATTAPPTPKPSRVDVTMTLLLNLNIESFDKANFTASLASALSLAATDIQIISVTAGSVNVTFRILSSNAVDKYTQLENLIKSNSTLIQGLKVTSYHIITTVIPDTNTTEPAGQTPQSPADEVDAGVVAGAVIGSVVGLALCIAGCFFGYHYYKKMKSEEELEAADKEFRAQQKVPASLNGLEVELPSVANPHDGMPTPVAHQQPAAPAQQWDPMVQERPPLILGTQHAAPEPTSPAVEMQPSAAVMHATQDADNVEVDFQATPSKGAPPVFEQPKVPVTADPSAADLRKSIDTKKDHKKSTCPHCQGEWEAVENCPVAGRAHKIMHKEFKADKKARKLAKQERKKGVESGPAGAVSDSDGDDA